MISPRNSSSLFALMQGEESAFLTSLRWHNTISIRCCGRNAEWEGSWPGEGNLATTPSFFFNETVIFTSLYKAVNSNITTQALPSALVIPFSCDDPLWSNCRLRRSAEVLGWEKFFFSLLSNYWNKQQHWAKKKMKHSPDLQLFSRLVLVYNISFTNQRKICQNCLKSESNLRHSKRLITNVVYTHLIQHTRSNFLTLFSILFAYKYKSIPQDGTFLLATHTIINTYPLQMFPDVYDM